MPWEPISAADTLSRLGGDGAFPSGQAVPVTAYPTPAGVKDQYNTETGQNLSLPIWLGEQGFGSNWTPQQESYIRSVTGISEAPAQLPFEAYTWTQTAAPYTENAPSWVDQLLNQAALNVVPKNTLGVPEYAPGWRGFNRLDTEIMFNTGNMADRWSELAGYQIPSQFRGDDWYARVDVTRPDWWRDPRAIQFYQQKEGSELMEALSAAMTIARVAGMISSFGGSNLLGDLAGNLGFGGGGGMDFDFGSLFDLGGGASSAVDPMLGGFDIWSPSAISGYLDLGSVASNAVDPMLGGFDIWTPDAISGYLSSDFGGIISSLGDIAGYMDSPSGYGGILPSVAGAYSPTNIGSYGLFNNPPTPSFLDNASSWFSGNNLSRLASFGSSIYGMSQAKKQRELAKKQQELAARAAAQADPFGPHRAQYGRELAALSANPSSITGRPGYQFRLDEGLNAIRRRMAASGYSGSGNEAIAMMRYGQDYASGELNTEMQRLASLAGAQFAPSGGQYLMQGGLASMQGNQAANDLASRSLASLGYGLATNNRDLQDIILRSVLQGR